MRGIKFTLKGTTAFFKKPDVNTFIYFTYGQIHKVALLGVLGSILGLRGYGSQKNTETYPEFYDKLKDLQIAIVPMSQNERQLPGAFGKKVQTFNNSVGYASQEAGGNLITKEQWLEQPIWQIYIAEGHPYYESLVKCLLENRYTYIPYLGKNDHLATILDVEEVELEEKRASQKINSLFIKQHFIVEEDEEEDFFESTETYYKYEEKLPIKLEPEHNQYELESFILTNRMMKPKDKEKLYADGEQIIYFF